MFVESSKTYIGVVEDNEDPKRIGRCRVRVIDVFDEIPVEDIPWASPWKDINGNEFNVPEKGKVVTCVFDSGNIYKPEYIYADHYNLNLEKKLKELSPEGYKSMKSIVFDHKTQIYSNDDEGLVIDYKFHNINFRDDTIDINLKDNYSKLALGDRDADQQVILGTNFLTWFDKFIKELASLGGGPYLGNVGAPVIPMPSFVRILDEYFLLRDPKFLSDNVYVNSNFSINRVTNAQTGIYYPKFPARKSEQVKGDDFRATENITESTIQFDDFAPSFSPTFDTLNDSASKEFDPNSSDVIPKSNPVYLDETKGALSEVISDFAKELIRVAETQLNVQENPKNSNTGPEIFVYQDSTSLRPVKPPKPGEKYGKDKPGWPWCAAFICFLFKSVASDEKINYSFSLPKTASAFGFENWAKNNSKYVELIYPPFEKIKPGDIIVFDFASKGQSPQGHIGIATSTISNGRVLTIEGNTSPGDIPDIPDISNNFSSLNAVPGVSTATGAVNQANGAASQASNVAGSVSSQTGNIPGSGQVTGAIGVGTSAIDSATSALNNPDLSGIINFNAQREGDGVYRKSRKLKFIRSVIRLKYDESKVELKPKEEVVAQVSSESVVNNVSENVANVAADSESSQVQSVSDTSVESSTVGKTGLTREEINNGGLESITKRINNNTPYEFGYVYFQGLFLRTKLSWKNERNEKFESRMKKLESSFISEWDLSSINSSIESFSWPKTKGATTLNSYQEWNSLYEKYFKRLG